MGETRGRTLESTFHLKGVGSDESKDPRETGNFDQKVFLASRVHGNRASTVLRGTVGKGPYSVVNVQKRGNLAGGLPYQGAPMHRTKKPKRHASPGMPSCGGVQMQASALRVEIIDSFTHHASLVAINDEIALLEHVYDRE